MFGSKKPSHLCELGVNVFQRLIMISNGCLNGKPFELNIGEFIFEKLVQEDIKQTYLL